MTLLTAEDLSKSFGEKTLFEHISFSIQDEDKIGLIGINGTGKSTLLKIISGQESSETGIIHYAKGLRIAYLPQNPDFNPEATVFEQVFAGPSSDMALLKEYEQAAEMLEHNPNDETVKSRLLKLTNEIQAKNLWDIESQVKIVLTKLGVPNFDQKIRELSGGQKKRIALACALITPSDLLILDEPTNHMDNGTIDWLEKFLLARKGAVLMITHDRYFLDRVVGRILELDLGQLYNYGGNYSQFVEKKAERQELAGAMERKRQNLYRRELEWMRRGARARTTKQKARIDRFETIEDTSYALDDSKLSVNTGFSRLGQKIIEMEHLTKSFGDKTVLKDFSYILLRDDRIGIIGDNGIGKSSLLNLITGRLTPDSGNIEIGQTVNVGYFSQESEEMNVSLRAIDYIKEVAEYISVADGTKLSASQMMENFLFTGDMQWTPIERLSGGERRRLYLLRILIGEPNILILDEPTNDLDIDTLKVLENYIDDFKGAVITVSHDRYFLDRTCRKIFDFVGDGRTTLYFGNYSDYLDQRPTDVIVQKSRSDLAGMTRSDEPRAKKPTMTYKEKQEFENIDDDLEKLEEKLAHIEEELLHHGSDFVMLQELSDKKDAVENELLEKMERQEYLTGLAAEIAAYKRN